MTIERHPLEPFLPPHARILFLGSFPPPQARWSMTFFYPNFINDFWRIMGLLYFNDRNHFIVPGEKRFDQARVIDFATERGLAFYDTATVVRRLKDNASDQFLEVVEPTSIADLLTKIPECHHIVTTGQKASQVLQEQLGLKNLPAIGESVHCRGWGRELDFWRMPSTSRAYPLALEKKAAYYNTLKTTASEQGTADGI